MSGDGQGALIAEVSMLRQHARREAERRRQRAAAAAEREREHPRFPPRERYWQYGREQAMRDVLDVANEAAKRTDSLEFAMKDVAEYAAGVIRLSNASCAPSKWLREAGSEQ